MIFGRGDAHDRPQALRVPHPGGSGGGRRARARPAPRGPGAGRPRRRRHRDRRVLLPAVPPRSAQRRLARGGLDGVGDRQARRAALPGPRQPNLPAWGFEDESDPRVFERKIDAAARHGLSAFIFDWYWYENRPFLNGALDRGYLGARNTSRLKFALMWANHDWWDLYPHKRAMPLYTLLPGAPVTAPDSFRRATDHIIERYLGHQQYWRIDGRPYFSIYDLGALEAGAGGRAETRALLDGFRDRARAAGHGELHLDAVITQWTPEPGKLLTRARLRQRHPLHVDPPRVRRADRDRHAVREAARARAAHVGAARRRAAGPLLPDRQHGLGPQPAHRAVGRLRAHRLPVHAGPGRQHAAGVPPRAGAASASSCSAATARASAPSTPGTNGPRAATSSPAAATAWPTWKP